MGCFSSTSWFWQSIYALQLCLHIMNYAQSFTLGRGECTAFPICGYYLNLPFFKKKKITVFCYKPLLTVQSVSNMFAKKWKTKTWMETLKSYKRCPGLNVRFGIMKNVLEILISTAQYAQEWTRPRWWVWSIIPTTRRSELKIGAWKTAILIRYGA